MTGPVRGRLLVAAAALLWSLSGLATRLLQYPSALHVDTPPLTAGQIAFYRLLFAGALFLPMLRPRLMAFAPAMLPMVLIFAVMNVVFLRAMAGGSAANAIWLQYTAPLWVYLAAKLGLGEAPAAEPGESRGRAVLALGMAGVCVILAGGWLRGPADRLPVIGMALASGVTYAGVLVCLGLLRRHSSAWMTALNHFGGALLVLPLVWDLPLPTGRQLAFLAAFGVVQMGIPYWLVARGLRHVSAREAALISLLEPVLNPVWAYLFVPEREVPAAETWVGAGLILLALLWRYAPLNRPRPSP